MAKWRKVKANSNLVQKHTGKNDYLMTIFFPETWSLKDSNGDDRLLTPEEFEAVAGAVAGAVAVALERHRIGTRRKRRRTWCSS